MFNVFLFIYATWRHHLFLLLFVSRPISSMNLPLGKNNNNKIVLTVVSSVTVLDLSWKKYISGVLTCIQSYYAITVSRSVQIKRRMHEMRPLYVTIIIRPLSYFKL